MTEHEASAPYTLPIQNERKKNPNLLSTTISVSGERTDTSVSSLCQNQSDEQGDAGQITTAGKALKRSMSPTATASSFEWRLYKNARVISMHKYP